MEMRKSLTLVEMIIVVSLLTIIVGITYGVLHTNQISDRTAQAILSLSQETKRALDTIGENLKAGSFSHLTISDNNPDEIEFQVPLSVDPQTMETTWGAFWEGTDYPDHHFHYYLEDNYIKKAIVDNSSNIVCGPKIIAQNIKDMQIEHPAGSNYIRVALVAEKYVIFLNREIEYNMEVKIYPQN